ncbi:hypothetical protein PQ469_10970 [Mucilaginibacter sp. KACC 22773]|uniref:hypothetical protein n=1 Tax=Mucilaginibacter sp. KACC 22773 TaxID=3025671 RepID=UPI00236673A8|nr:hypothetical protein [Mucilaginibacter sp. KACC 22773]WDF80528.1 hypothetical protein PQ469_10970 [Mucilaginibacter sp. KACC 22773]
MLLKKSSFITFLLALIACQIQVSAQVSAIKPGEVWPDNRGQHVQAHGGGIIKIGKLYYWFGEDRAKDNDPAKRYVACYSSPDLTNWTFRNKVIKTSDPANFGEGFVLERPKVFYNQKNRQYVMYLIWIAPTTKQPALALRFVIR